MKRKVFSVLFALVLVLSFSLVTAVPASAVILPEFWVDDDWLGCTPGNAVDGHICGTDGFGKIQDGINAVTSPPGGIVHVAAGTYNENVDVNKDGVFLIGAGASSTTVQAVNSSDYVFDVTQSNVTITGFMVTGATDTNYAGIAVGCGADNCTISSNIATGNWQGIRLSSSDGSTISGNQVYENLAEGIYLANCSNCVIDGNIVHDNDMMIHPGILLDHGSGNQVKNNEVYNEAYGIGLLGSDDNTILNNSIHDNGHGIYIDWGTITTSDNNKILGNSIVYNSATEESGIHLTTGAAGTVINFNNIEGNSPTPSSYGVSNENSSAPADATNNWWGDDSGPSHSPGTGDKVSDHVTYFPWLGAPLELPAAYHETLGPGIHAVDASDEADTVVTLTVNATTSETDIDIARYESQPFPEEPFPDASLGKFIDVHLSNCYAVVWPILIEMHYTDGEVRAAGIVEDSLGLYYYETVDTFHRCSDTGVDTTNNIIWANVTKEEAGCLLFTPFGGGGSTVAPTVGGTVYPVDKVSILMPWIGLAVALALAGVFGTRFVRRRVRG